MVVSSKKCCEIVVKSLVAPLIREWSVRDPNPYLVTLPKFGQLLTIG
jgi:hypothetical protein